ncbi:MAG: CCA tRNA nucleotidyltransferase [Ruminococcus flavefaciens]|jgi:tRNA nucleotidyltransferase (CCA-adding enzyme)|nr:CCA tRNA nucleotidyltransferase [Ruminococcus flavefaciens]
MKEFPKAEALLKRLEDAGFEAYYVGGCVRDHLMGRAVHDVDITTNALPEQTAAVFEGYKVIPTGIRHGTVTVLAEGTPYEITTYRVDGSYSDSRRPDSVEFTPDIVQDLARRDFTMNAIAMDIRGNIVDPFGGRGDIEHSLIRCVGEPEKRFTEDALRIMRGIRFASQLGFGIEEKTAQAIIDMRGRLSIISRERVREELDKLLCGKDCGKVLTDYRVIIAEIIPEMVACFGFDQFSRYHKYDVYEHIVKAVTSAPQDQLILRRALLLHDIAKPQMFTLDENGVGHFKGHAKVSAEMAKEILTRLRFDNRTIALTSQLISHHSDKIHSERQIRLMVSEFGIETFLMLMDFKKYDNCGKNDFVLDENKEFDRFKVIAREFADSGECITLSQLAISGSDLTELGFRGKEIGTALAQLHSLVIIGDLPNDKQALTNYILNEINTTLE